MAELVVKSKNKKEEKLVRAFLESLEIEYATEIQEDQALDNAMQQRKKSKKNQVSKVNVIVRKIFERDTLELSALIQHRLVRLNVALRKAITLSE